jgi:hypothetical protein
MAPLKYHGLKKLSDFVKSFVRFVLKLKDMLAKYLSTL